MEYPEPLIFDPLQLPHEQTFILLHGRGSWAEKFGPELLKTPIHNPKPILSDCNEEDRLADGPPATLQTPKPAMTLQTAFPHARFVFPTAPRTRATIYKRARTHQWFDNWKLDPPATEREELQIEGLHETTQHLHRLLRTEIAIVPGGAKNVVLGGLSQGCAASLIALFLWQGEDLGAVVGMCGWLPFTERLIAKGRGEEYEQDDYGVLGSDPFEVDAYVDDKMSDEISHTPAKRAVAWLREHLNLPALQPPSELLPMQKIPIYLGHGTQDEKVSIELGRRASECLDKMGARVCWKEYGDLGHWYSNDMLIDVLQFLEESFKNTRHP